MNKTHSNTTYRPCKFVHDAFREGILLRSKTWGKKSRDPRKARRDGKREVASED
jgi:hypothetical protein